MTEKTPKIGAPKPPVVENVENNEIFVSDTAGVAFIDGNCHLTFAATRADHSAGRDPAPISRQVCCRLVMPLNGTVELWQILGKLMSELETKGVIVRTPGDAITIQ